MRMNDQFFSYLGLSMRAGKLVTGDSGVMKAIRAGEAKLVVLAADASDNARKKYRDKCAFYGVPLIVAGTRFRLGRSIGKEERVVVAVCDSGLARMLEQCQENPAEVKQFE
jgi:ribosomal protein L7Ae-like RNA K-turn-binding protein